MYSTEEEEYAFCAACDGERSRADRVCILSGDGLLCFECATVRDGVYEELLDRWTVTPRVEDLRPEASDGMKSHATLQGHSHAAAWVLR